jgi:FtsP/CotA-like multicopper oxidase with cupredoxin domain
MDDAIFSRRDALKLTAFGAAALTLPYTAGLHGAQASQLPASKLPTPYTLPFMTPPVKQPVGPDSSSYEIDQREFGAKLIPGFTTTMWGYDGMFPGPTFVVQQNQRVTIRQTNKLPPRHPVLGYVPATSTHLHGHPSLPQYDGYANDLTFPQEYKDYQYENSPTGRTLWYHDHGVHHTSENIYMGLAGLYLLIDPREAALGLPRGSYERSLVINDVMLDSKGQLLFDNHSESSLFGDVVLVNGVPWPRLQVEPRRYLFRILNASLSRGYRLRLSNGAPMTVVGTDAGLMQNPQRVSELKMGNAERYEVVIDFTDLAGARIELRNAGVPNAVDFDNTGKVMMFDVSAPLAGPDTSRVPAVLDQGSSFLDLKESDATKKRKLVFERKNSEWTINGDTWAEVEASGFQRDIADPALGDTEIWELENKSGGWFHPIHIHLVDFKILDRNGNPPPPQERGPKDTVYLGENEKVRLLMTFEHHSGRYMLHCHNAVHEDHDMMFQMRVVGPDDPNPITAAPAQPLPAPPLP